MPENPNGAVAEKPEKIKRVPCRGENDDLFDSSDVSYDTKTQFPPKKADFKHEYDFFDFKAALAQATVTKYKELAEEARTLGGSADRAKAKKLRKYMAEAEQIKADLAAEIGEDALAKLLGAMQS